MNFKIISLLGLSIALTTPSFSMNPAESEDSQSLDSSRRGVRQAFDPNAVSTIDRAKIEEAPVDVRSFIDQWQRRAAQAAIEKKASWIQAGYYGYERSRHS